MATSTIKLGDPLTAATVVGNIVKTNESAGTAVGYGAAFFRRVGKLIIVDFEAQITTAGTSSSAFTIGISADNLNAISPTFPANITAWNSSIRYYKSTGELDASIDGYAGLANANGNKWYFGRYYNTSGSAGNWADSKFTSGMRIVGTLYGQLS